MDDNSRQSRFWRTTSAIVVSALVLAAGPLQATALPADSPRRADTESAAEPSRFIAVSPTRVHDSRDDGQPAAAQSSFTFSPLSPDVVEAAAVEPDDVTAVVVNVTVLNATGPGYVTLSPHGSERPTTSTVNYVSPTQINANLATSRVGDGGLLDVFAFTSVDVVIDVQGVFVGATSARSGRHEPIEPQRLLDTRLGESLAPLEERIIDVTDAGVPADATAALVTITAVGTSGPGYFTAWPADHRRPTASNLNFSGPGQTVSNGAIVSISNGRFLLASSIAADAVVDVSGYMTGTDAPDLESGLFVATDPHRLVDSRTGQMAYARSTTPFELIGRGQIPQTGVSSVAVNITVTSMERPGFVAALASGRRYDHSTSTVNVGANIGTASSAAVVRVGTAGEGIGLYTSADAHVIIDVSGYYLGEPDPDSAVEHLAPELPPIPPASDNFALLHSGSNLPAGYTGHVEWQGSKYVGWHPCRPIRYIVHDRLASPMALEVLQEVVDETSAATGFTFVPIGRAADHISPEPRDLGTFSQPIDAELLVGFSTPLETPTLAGSTKGFGGIGWHAEPYRIEGRTVYHSGGGLVAVDIAELRGRDQLKAVLLHEFAHFIGLGHVSVGLDEVMVHAVGSTPQPEFGIGDLNGLRLLGIAGCQR